MAIALPVRVVRELLCFKLVDASGAVICWQLHRDWHGVPRHEQTEVVRENFEALAKALNPEGASESPPSAPTSPPETPVRRSPAP